MTYSLKQLPNKPYEFPAPPLYAVWIEEQQWDYRVQSYKTLPGKTGQIRHVPNLTKARKRVREYACREGTEFTCDWSIYKWDGIEYVLQYEGNKGQKIDRNALLKVAPKDLNDVELEERPGFEDELEAALRSIASAVT